MSNYVLIHGGSASKEIWNEVIILLEKNNQNAYALTLSDEKSATLTSHIRQVNELILSEGIRDMIITGHSYGGLVVAGVADKNRGIIKREIYLDTCLPERKESLFSLIKKYGFDPESFAGLNPYPPYIEPLFFDESFFKTVPKTYIHCTKGEFLPITSKVKEIILRVQKKDNWEYFEIDSEHNCPVEKPFETAEILLRYKDAT